MKKALKIAGISLLVVFVLLFTLPFLFKDKIFAVVKTEVNNSVDAKVQFSDLSLSFFSHFPRLTVALHDLSIANTGRFEGDTLLVTKKLEASLNLFSLFGKEMNVDGIYLVEPRIHARIDKNGFANWDIAKADTASSQAQPESTFAMQLNKYAITDGFIRYEDETIGMYTRLENFDHTGKGNFMEDNFVLSTKSTAAAAYFSYENIPYLVNAESAVDMDIDVNAKTSTYTFKNAAMTVNNLKMVADGFVQLVNDSTYKMDLNFDAPSNSFKNILSLVPAIYKNDFDKIKTGGEASIKGFVKGIYSNEEMPAYKMDVVVKNAFFQYPDLPQPVKNIQLDIHLENPDGKPDNAVVNISKGHMEMGKEPFDFHLLFKKPETAKYLDAAIKGNINLDEVSKFIKLDGATKLSGRVFADAFAKGNLSDLQNQQGNFVAGGFMQIRNLFYSSKDFPQPVKNGQLDIQLHNAGGNADATSINITKAHIEVGSNPFDFNVEIKHPVSSMDFRGKAKGNFLLDDVKQFVTLDPGTSLKGKMQADISFAGSKAAIDKNEYQNIALDGNMQLNDVFYASADYPTGVKISSTLMQFSMSDVNLRSLAGSYMGTNFTASGTLNNILAYSMNDEVLGGTLSLTADKMNLNQLMGTDTANTTEASSDPFAVPENMNLNVHAKAGSVVYDKVNYRNIRGLLIVKDETVYLKDVYTEALDGTIGFNGSYGTKTNKKKPAINIEYDIKNIDVQKAFLSFVTVQKLLPIGKFLSGKISSKLSMTGLLNGDMMPDLNSLTGNGDLFVIEGVLGKFAPLEKISSTLQVDELKQINVKDLKSHISFANGKVQVKPFNLKVKDIDMQIGGAHGFDQEIDYVVGMKLPRKYLGTSGNALINNLSTQAAAKGVSIQPGETVNLNIRMGGSMLNPSMKTDVRQSAGDITKELKQQATDIIQQKADSSKKQIKDTLTSVKNAVVNDLKKEALNRLTQPKDSNSKQPLQDTKTQAVESIKGSLKGILRKK